MFEEISVASGHGEPPLKLLFRDGGSFGANALALPGGTIILTDQLEALIENDDEIAGVFAHEIRHVSECHSLRQIYRVLGLTFMIFLIGDGSGQVVEEVLGQAVLLESFSYTREFEISADNYSVRVMEKPDAIRWRLWACWTEFSKNMAWTKTKRRTGWIPIQPTRNDAKMLRR